MISQPSIQILFANIHKRLSGEQWANFFSMLPEHFQSRISRYKKWQDRQAGLFGKLLLLNSLNKYKYPSDCLNRIGISKFGRPFIDNKIDFNISHSGEYVLCAVTDSGRLGIDIEKIKPVDPVDFKLFLSPDKMKMLSSSGSMPDAFYRVWTISESVLKADGRGLSARFSEINIGGSKVVLDNNTWFVKNVFIDSDYSCHLATDIKDPKIHLNRIEFN